MSAIQPIKTSPFLPILLAIAIFMQQLDSTILNTALPAMAKDLGESPLNMQSTIIAYALTLAIMMPLSGFLSDRIGTRYLFMSSLVIFILGSLLCAVASSLNLLIIARIIQGIGGAMLTPVARLTMVQAYERSRLITIMNYALMPALIGPVIGPILGGYLVDYASWHWIFLLNLPIGLLGLVATWYLMPNFSQEVDHFDGIGFTLFAVAAFCLSLAFETMSHPNSWLFSLLMIIAGIVTLATYMVHARHLGNGALYPANLIAVRTFRLGLAGNLVSRLGMSSLPLLLPLMFQVAFGFSAVNAAWLLMPIAVAAIIAKPMLTPIMNHFGYRQTLTVNTRLIGLLIFSLAFISATTPQWLLILQLFILGAANSLQFTGMNTITLADLRSTQASSGTSLMGVNQQLALSFGIAIGAILLQNLSRTSFVGTNISLAFRITFVVLGVLTFASSWIFARLHPTDGDNLLPKRHDRLHPSS